MRYSRGYSVEHTPTSISVFTSHSYEKYSYSLTYKTFVSFPKHKCGLSLVALVAEKSFICVPSDWKQVVSQLVTSQMP